ncbi:2-oxoglutarate-dependent dioxygenase AOP3-like [Lolium rigidum]|uniref:2-oxoglutarate-dependent dioxygenase AOP3-like n=1 Tax=Lolium rigidum TaxID=89674 RepID=UPI001F5C2E11|nr:2-oxoglutarate-dependent dioxygenase AOP3-like [Lolium rigidum]XP_051213286.1 2-oxoglutarate-dependent dioxygenase AOP3-like [Lolium perenne]
MEITKVDLRGLEPGGRGWDEARDAVTASVVAYGFVLVQHAGLDRDKRLALFDRVMPELFALPAEAKRLNVCDDVIYGGYIGQIPGLAYETMRIQDVADAGTIRDFAKLFWTQGNPAFCEIAAEFAKNTIKLDQTVTEMVLEGLGVRDRHAIDSHREQLRYSFRMSYYSTSPEDDAARVSLTPHRDYVMTNVIQQHEVEGLEVQLSDGSWFAVPPELDTYIFVAGELFNVVTNGRVKACLHRVRTPSNRERYSALLGTMPAKGSTVRAIDELVDEDHPLVYNPCDPYEYCSYRYSEEGLRFRDALKAFCGVVKDEPLSA